MSQTGFTASAGQRRHDGLDGLQTGEGGVEFMRIGETKGILHARPLLRSCTSFHLLWPVCGKTFTFSN
ncbi:hypothetical protein A676_03512 [Salmonella enterica subsp. enterica serovar Enteritidis str. 2010K-0262]|nr:hypothetical protein A672_00041 [Salmonella enterica subsp. enterica serovar Enteritidis str. 08-1080]EPI80675.1 hypothetical protein A676_03512 [Salmonella enterica subsp. enterica serovar Enteritidis str. 2010K-0262]EPI84881.1 hypothetical protein A674_03429 [Salmonella enterica subsp. enterica serovar Enteritidis str. 2009K1651]EPI85530.1 hypothetical protein A675_02473 [Salmonella enterica subsp. enterica serovar Enteritidis str. 2009K1726]